MPYLGMRLGIPGGNAASIPPWVLNAGGIRPDVDFDFVNGLSYGRQLSDLNIVRAVTGTGHTFDYADDTSGNWSKFGANTLRITNKGLLIEDSKSNVMLWSQDFSNAAWAKVDITVTTDATTSPDGGVNADLITEGTAGTASVAQTATATTASLTHSAQFFIKPSANNSWIRCLLTDGTTSTGMNFWVNLSTGAVGSSTIRTGGTVVQAAVEPAANGFWRVKMAATFAAAVSNLQIIIHSASADLSSTRVNGAAYYLWQGEGNVNSSFVTSPIFTTSAAVTRSNDYITIPSLNASASLSVGSMYWEVTPEGWTGSGTVLGGISNAQSFTNVAYCAANNANVTANLVGKTGSSGFIGTGITIGAKSKIMHSWTLGTGGSVIAKNGLSNAGNVTAMPVGAVNWFTLGNQPWSANGGSMYNGYFSRFSFFASVGIPQAVAQAATV